MEQTCSKPTRLADKPAEQKDVEVVMNKDAKSLRTCRSRHAAIRDFYRTRDGRDIPK